MNTCTRCGHDKKGWHDDGPCKAVGCDCPGHTFGQAGIKVPDAEVIDAAWKQFCRETGIYTENRKVFVDGYEDGYKAALNSQSRVRELVAAADGVFDYLDADCGDRNAVGRFRAALEAVKEKKND
jgi:hypothetical protein